MLHSAHVEVSEQHCTVSASPLPPSLGFQVRLRLPGSDNTRFHPELSRWPSPTFLLETGFLSEPGVVCLGNAGEPVLGCAWQCWSYSMLFYGCWGSRLRLSCLHGERFTSEPCCQPLLHFILIRISYFIRKGTSICVCLLNCSEIYFMAECLVCFRGVSVTPGNVLRVFCSVGFSGILVGLWYCASLYCYFIVLSHASVLPVFIANIQKMFIIWMNGSFMGHLQIAYICDDI